MKELTEAQKEFLASIKDDEEIGKFEGEVAVLVKPLIDKYVELCQVLLKHTTPELLEEHGPIVIIDPLLEGLMMTLRTSILDKVDPEWQMRAIKELFKMLSHNQEPEDRVAPPKKHLH